MLFSFTAVAFAGMQWDSFTGSNTTSIKSTSSDKTVPAATSPNVANATNPTSTCWTQPRYFDQKIDHSSSDITDMFKQRYMLNTTYFKEGGPIILYQGAESPEIQCPDTLVLSEWAKELGGLIASLEHRFFGQSRPFGEASDSFENLAYLTLDNVICDAVEFVNFVKSNVTGVQDSKTIVVGDTYGGYLATAFRQNHPETFHGAVSVAAPFRGFGDASESGEERFNSFNLVQQTYMHRSFDAFTRIKDAFQDASDLYESGKVDTLKDELSLCTAPNASVDSTDGILLPMWLFNAYVYAPQNNHRPENYFNVSGPFLDTVIGDILAAPSPLAAMNETIWHVYGQTAQNGCLNFSSTTESATDGPTFPFLYLRCNWYPQNSEVDPKSIWPAVSTSDPSDICKAIMQMPSPPKAAEIFKNHKLTKEDIAHSTRIMFTEGEYDPHTGFAVPQSWLGDNDNTDADASVRVFVAGAGYAQDLRPALSPSLDGPAVVEARNIELNIIKGWLKSS